MAATLLEQISEDLDGKYDPVFGFAESVTGPAGAFYAVFSNEYRESAAGGYTGARSSAPMLRCRDADALNRGDRVTVRGVVYQVAEPMPNGYGETEHRLQRV